MNDLFTETPQSSANESLKSPSQHDWICTSMPTGRVITGKTSCEAMLSMVCSGSLEVTSGEWRDQQTATGEIYLLPPQSAYSLTYTEESTEITCRFSTDTLLNINKQDESLIAQAANNPYHFTTLRADSELWNFIRLQHYYLREKNNSKIFFELKKQELFLLLFMRYTKQELAAFFQPMLGTDVQFRQFVINNHASAHNVQELAAMANYSTSGFIKKFRRCFNESPYKWMSSQKAEHIIRDISAGLIPLKEIAIKYNFSSYQHFAEFCKNQYGVPPSEVTQGRIARRSKRE